MKNVPEGSKLAGMDLDRIIEDYEVMFTNLRHPEQPQELPVGHFNSATLRHGGQGLRLEHLLLGKDFVAGIHRDRLVLAPMGGRAQIELHASGLARAQALTTELDLHDWLGQLHDVTFTLYLGSGLVQPKLRIADFAVAGALVCHTSAEDGSLLIAPFAIISRLEIIAVDKAER